LVKAGGAKMTRLTLGFLAALAAAIAAGCALPDPVMLTDDGMYVDKPIQTPARKYAELPDGPISMKQAVELALANSPSVRMADIGVKMGKDGVLLARSSSLPKVQLQSNYHHVDAVSKMDLGIPGQPAVSFGTRDSTNVAAMMIVPVYTFGKNAAAQEQALRSAEAAEFDAARARQMVVAEASGAYFRVLEAKEFAALAGTSVEQIKAHLTVAEQFFEQGLVTQNDVLAAKVRLLQMEHELLRAKSNVQIATANLNRVIGLPISNGTQLSDEFSPVNFDLTEEQCLQAAIEYRPELGSMDRQRKAAVAALTGAKAMRLPTINFSGGWNWTSSKNIKNKDNWSIDLIAEWTLFGGMGITAGIRQARHAIEQLDEGLRQLIDGIALEVKTSYLNLVQSGKGIEVAKEAVKQAQENLRVFRERYAQGLVTSTDVLDAESQLARARADLARSLYENNSALVNMENAMALPIEEVRRMHSQAEEEPPEETPAAEKEDESGQ
jgi:outer membrane protein TolC